MEFEWDDNKNRENIHKHQIDFLDAWRIFESPILRKLDQRKDYGEKRWIGLGILFESIVVIVFTIRGEKIRIISIRKANHHERTIYKKTFKESH